MSERLTYVEIDLNVCTLNYGVTCSAELGVTGSRKCFNTRRTCQVPAEFDGDTQVLRLAEAKAYNPGDIRAIENITSVSYQPSIVKLGESIGARSSLTITCTDHPSPDTGAGGDPYLDSRDYDPYLQGTFWGKLKARHPFLRGRMLRWYNGRVGQTLEQMERRTFIIDSVMGPDSSGRFVIKALDPLSLTDDQRALAPRLSRGLLAAAISDTDTSLTLTPAGIGNAEYPASGKVSIGGNEIVSFTRTGDTMTIARGVNNTEPSDHDADDRVQLVLEYTGEDPADIINDLAVTYGNVPSSFINIGNWQAETAEFLARLYSGIIAEPTPVVQLINEILEQAAISVWWDEIGETIRLQVLRNVTQGTFVYNDDYMMRGSFSQKDQPEKRVSQVWTYFGQIDPLEPLDDPKNYRNTLLTVNNQSEVNWGTPAIKRIYSRWITQFARPAAERLNNLILGRYAEPPKMFMFDLLRDSGTPLPSLGSGLQVESFFNQDDTGAKVTSPAQAVSIKVSDSGYKVSAEEIIISEDVDPDDPTVKLVPIDSDALNFNFREAYLAQYPEAEAGDTIICEVRSGVVVGSASTSLPAWRTGTGWPSGITLLLRVLDGALIAGKGGAGGAASASVTSGGTTRRSAGSGGSGGIALVADEAGIEIDNLGVIGGGGGGGGGGARSATAVLTAGLRVSAAAASGGGGGQGFSVTDGGTASVSVPSGQASDARNGGSGTPTAAGQTQTASAERTVSVTARGGAGGALGQAGSNGTSSGSGSGATGSGGAPGNAVQGDSLITWINEGDIRGARVG